MVFFRANWLQVIVGAYLLGMVLYGHYRGLIRLAVSMLALVLTLTAVHFALPYVGRFIREKTPVQAWIADSVSDTFGIHRYEEGSDAQLPEAQQKFIEEMQLPDEWKELLLENNKDDIYEIFGVDAFAGYVGNYLSNVIVNFVGFVVLFILIYVSLKILAGALDLVARLPVLSGMNQLAGAFLGGLQGLFFLWLAALLVAAFSTTTWATAVLDQIAASPWLSFLYHYNPISRLVLGIVRGIIS